MVVAWLVRAADWYYTSRWLARQPRDRRVTVPLAPHPDLSASEWEVLQALVNQVAPVAIAEGMGVNLAKVRMRIQSIRTKYQLPDIRITIRLARRFGMPPRPNPPDPVHAAVFKPNAE
jgi:DNA-binding CsgD family transcriptional regulator